MDEALIRELLILRARQTIRGGGGHTGSERPQAVSLRGMEDLSCALQ